MTSLRAVKLVSLWTYRVDYLSTAKRTSRLQMSIR